MSLWLWIGLAALAFTALSVISWRQVRRLRNRFLPPMAAATPHSAPPGLQRVAVVLNSSKPQAEQAERIIRQRLATAGWPTPFVLYTTADEAGAEQAEQARRWGADLVIAGGGDGTMRVVASTLKGTGVPMGVVPLGTGNLLARNLDLDLGSLDHAIAIALFGQQRHIDTASMRIEDETTGAVAEHTFLVIAGMGVDAEVVGSTYATLKRSIGWLAYSEAWVRRIPGTRKRVSIRMDDEPVQHRRVRSVLFCNCARLPGGIDFVPGALIDDGILDIVVMSPRSFLGWALMTVKVLLRNRRSASVMSFYRSRTLSLHSAAPQATQVDGDPAGLATTVQVQVEPKALLVRVPKNS